MTFPDELIQPGFDPQESQSFAEKAFTDMLGFMNICMCVLGDRLGLFKDLVAHGPATSAELAARAGIVERYAREWLTQMACAGYLKYDPADGRFCLPPAHASTLAEEGGLNFMGGFYQNVQCVERGMFSKLIRAFREGGGIPYAEYDENFWDGLDRYTIGFLNHTLVQQYIPAMPEVQAALERGAKVADMGCGRGGVLLMLARAFPNSHFVGYDPYAPNINRAQAEAERAGLAERVQYYVHNATLEIPERYDVIFSFDATHHATDVLAYLSAIHLALNPGGIFVCSEAASADTLEGNIGPGGAILYASSVIVCVPQVLSEGDVALGNAGLPFSRMRVLTDQAGFGNIRLVPLEGAANNLYEIKS
jgi:2-polyprenyl-3-methyl-5-hydroxy-6-metoxy-1,4-benzoquinol methylase